METGSDDDDDDGCVHLHQVSHSCAETPAPALIYTSQTTSAAHPVPVNSNNLRSARTVREREQTNAGRKSRAEEKEWDKKMGGAEYRRNDISGIN